MTFDAEARERKHVLLTVDVEDWFQVENLRPWNSPRTWHQKELRVEESTIRVLDLLDELALCLPSKALGGQKALRATFFILGWIARRCPGIVKEIHSRGHEIASHGESHLLCSEMRADELYQDLSHSKAYLEDLIGERVVGYRAPSFSVTDVALEQIQKAGYGYDSSFNSFAFHHRYGKVELNTGVNHSGIAVPVRNGLYELPIGNLSIAGKTAPWGGGGYFRILPSALFAWGVKRILSARGAYVFYMHPWEFDPWQPRVREVPWHLGFRHYVNLEKTGEKLSRFVQALAQHDYVSCSDYLSLKTGSHDMGSHYEAHHSNSLLQ